MKLSLTIDRDEQGAWVVASPVLPDVISVGKTKAAALKNLPAVVSECLATLERGGLRPRKHRFASEALIGSLATGLKTGDNPGNAGTRGEFKLPPDKALA